MTDPKVIPISPDNTGNDVTGTPQPLEGEGSITIENPDAPVNLGPDIVVVDGVPEGDKLEDQFKPTEKGE